MASEPMSLTDLPVEIQLKILSHFGPEDLCLNIAKYVKNGMFWLKIWNCGGHYLTPVIVLSCIAEVRCTALLGFSTN